MPETTPRAPHTHALCWACVAVTPQTVDGSCQTCRDRDRAAREYNVRQEMYDSDQGSTSTPFFDGLAVGMLLTTLAFFILRIAFS